jgi:hypothetical protein
MREIRTSGLMSGDGKRGGAQASVLAPILDSTGLLASEEYVSRTMTILRSVFNTP